MTLPTMCFPATANSFAAVSAGATVIDATVNGLGDRAGNASLEQIAVLLEREGFETGIDLSQLRPVSELVAERSGVPVSGLAPIIGDYAFDHRSPSHLAEPAEFEAVQPSATYRQHRLGPTAANRQKTESVAQWTSYFSIQHQGQANKSSDGWSSP